MGPWLVVLLTGCGDVKGDQPDAPRPIDSPGLDVASPDSSQARCDPSKPFGAPLALTELNTTLQEYTPSLSPDELTIYFASTRAGGSGPSDMYIATRSSPTAAFGAPALLAGKVQGGSAPDHGCLGHRRQGHQTLAREGTEVPVGLQEHREAPRRARKDR